MELSGKLQRVVFLLSLNTDLMSVHIKLDSYKTLCRSIVVSVADRNITAVLSTGHYKRQLKYSLELI